MSDIEWSRHWAMPSGRTFSIPPISDLIHRRLSDLRNGVIIDPFSNASKMATITNDINPEYETDYNLDAVDFLGGFSDRSVDAVLYDPPYSPRQVSECYKLLDRTVNMETTQSSFWAKVKKQIGRVVKPDGIVISCAWNSGGIGKSEGFKIIEVMLVPHGGAHNDTIVTVEKKNSEYQTELWGDVLYGESQK